MMPGLAGGITSVAERTEKDTIEDTSARAAFEIAAATIASSLSEPEIEQGSVTPPEGAVASSPRRLAQAPLLNDGHR
jgi:hypothetical protein